MKYCILIIVVIFTCGCVLAPVPDYIIKVHNQHPDEVPFPENGNSTLIFYTFPYGAREFYGLSSFDGNIPPPGYSAVEFSSGLHEIGVGRYNRYGELNIVLEQSFTFKYHFDVGGKYRIRYDHTHTMILEKAMSSETWWEMHKFEEKL